MAFVEHLGGYFAEFGEVAIWKNKYPVTVIFDNEFVLSNELVESLTPAVQVQADDMQGIAHGQTLKIRTTVYKIFGIEPDATGNILIVRLEKQ